MNYGRDVLLNPSTQYTGGTAMPTINPRGGVFGPQGRGGGIFSGVGQSSGSSGFPWKWLLLAGAAGGVGYLMLRGASEAGQRYEVRLYKKGGGTTYKSFDTEDAAQLYLGKQMDTGKYRDGDVSELGG